MARRPPDIHINLNVRGMRPSATVAINERCNELIAEGREVYKLGLGQSPFPVPDPVVRALKEHAHEKDYLPVKGLRALRDAVAEYHGRAQGVVGDGDDVLIGPGSKELMFILQLVYYGDIVIPTPAWVSYAPQANIVGRQVRWIHTKAETNWTFTPEMLEELCAPDPERPRIVILNYPSNPTGATVAAKEQRRLAAVARRHRVVLLSDEIYGELHHKGEHRSIAAHYPEGTIVSGGLSKWCGAGGWRLGTFMFPKPLRWLLDAMAAVASETYTSTSTPIQFAAVTAFRGGSEIESYLSRVRRVLAALGSWCAARLRRTGARSPAPVGGFYLFPDLSPLRGQLAARNIHTSTELCSRLLDDTGVAILPGSAFGRVEEELTVRIAYVNFDGGRAIKRVAAMASGAELDEAFLRRYCGGVLTAFERMCAWLEQPA